MSTGVEPRVNLEPDVAAHLPIVVDPRKSAFAIEGIGVGLVRGGKPW